MSRHFIFGILIFTICLPAALAHTTSVQQQPIKKQRGFFISIDGLNPNDLETLVQTGHLTEGFAELYHTAGRSHEATPVVTTLTAASHVGTITCSLPSDHGIYSNSFLVDGERVSGFAH